MNYFIILAFAILIAVLSLKIFKDFLAPTFLYSIAMTIGIMCSIVGKLYWNNISNIGNKTIFIIVLSLLSFFVGEFFARKLLGKFRNKDSYVEKKCFDIPDWIIILELSFIVITTLLLYTEVKRVAIIAGYTGGSFGDMLGKFKSLSILNTTSLIESGQGVNIFVSQMRKVCEILCFANIFFIVNNLVNKSIKNIKNVFYVIIIFFGFFLSILMSERMQIAIYITAFMFLFMALALRKMDFKDFIKCYFKKIVIFLFISVLGFCLMVPLLGKKLDNNFISYLSYYYGIEIPSLDIYMKKDNKLPEYFGQETLRGIYSVGYKLKLTDKIEPITTEWLTFEFTDGTYKSYSSNIFTSGKRYYHDFGWFGLVICQFLFALTFTIIYLNIFRFNNPILLIFYSSYIYMVIDQVRDDHFYSGFIHINPLIRIIVLSIFIFFVTHDISIKNLGKTYARK